MKGTEEETRFELKYQRDITHQNHNFFHSFILKIIVIRGKRLVRRSNFVYKIGEEGGG